MSTMNKTPLVDELSLSDLLDTCIASVLFYAGNVAYNKTAIQSGTHNGHVASRAVDGDIGPNLAHGRCAHPADDNRQPAWWFVDLGEVYQINYIVFFARNKLYG